MRKKSLTKIQVQENTVIIAKFAARLLILILTPLNNPESRTDYKVVVRMTYY